MRKFKYRFEKVLSFKRHQETDKMRVLASAQGRLQLQQQKIDSIRSDRSNQQTQAKSCLVGKIAPAHLSRYTRYYLLLKQLEIAGQSQLQKTFCEVNEKREELVHATRQKRIYEKLKDRHRAKYEKEYALYLQKENDELGQKLFFRKTGDSGQ